jgi:hypothetical protein
MKKIIALSTLLILFVAGCASTMDPHNALKKIPIHITPELATSMYGQPVKPLEETWLTDPNKKVKCGIWPVKETSMTSSKGLIFSQTTITNVHEHGCSVTICFNEKGEKVDALAGEKDCW